MTRSLKVRLMEKVNKNGPIPSRAPHLGPCWLWTGSLNRAEQGYGQIYVGPGKLGYVHRLSYEIANGSIPDDLEVDHLCFVTSCVRPDHLQATTRRVNVLRSSGFPAVHSKKTQCPQGHPYDAENTYVYAKKNIRCCRECMRQRHRRWYAKKKIKIG